MEKLNQQNKKVQDNYKSISKEEYTYLKSISSNFETIQFYQTNKELKNIPKSYIKVYNDALRPYILKIEIANNNYTITATEIGRKENYIADINLYYIGKFGIYYLEINSIKKDRKFCKIAYLSTEEINSKDKTMQLLPINNSIRFTKRIYFGTEDLEYFMSLLNLEGNGKNIYDDKIPSLIEFHQMIMNPYFEESLQIMINKNSKKLVLYNQNK